MCLKWKVFWYNPKIKNTLCIKGESVDINRMWKMKNKVLFIIIVLVKLSAVIPHDFLQNFTQAHTDCTFTNRSKGIWRNWGTTACYHLQGTDYYFFLFVCIILSRFSWSFAFFWHKWGQISKRAKEDKCLIWLFLIFHTTCCEEGPQVKICTATDSVLL